MLNPSLACLTPSGCSEFVDTSFVKSFGPPFVVYKLLLIVRVVLLSYTAIETFEGIGPRPGAGVATLLRGEAGCWPDREAPLVIHPVQSRALSSDVQALRPLAQLLVRPATPRRTGAPGAPLLTQRPAPPPRPCGLGTERRNRSHRFLRIGDVSPPMRIGLQI